MRFALRPEFKSSWPTFGSTGAQRKYGSRKAPERPGDPEALRRTPGWLQEKPGEPDGPQRASRRRAPEGPREARGGMHFLRDAWENGARVGPKCSTVEKRCAFFEGCLGKWRSGWDPRQGRQRGGGPLVWPKSGQISKGALLQPARAQRARGPGDPRQGCQRGGTLSLAQKWPDFKRSMYVTARMSNGLGATVGATVGGDSSPQLLEP